MNPQPALDEAMRAGRLEEALRIADELVSALRRSPPTGDLAQALADQARVRSRANQLHAAVMSAEDGLKVSARTGGACEPELRTVLADVYERLGELARADELCTSAVAQLLDGHESLDRGLFAVFPGLVRRKIASARISERRGHLRRAAYLLEGVLLDAQLAARPENAAGDANAAANAEFMRGIEYLVRLHRGRVARKVHDLALARRELVAALVGAAEIGDNEAVMYAHLELAVLARTEDDPVSALEHTLDSLGSYELGLSTIRDDELRVAVRSSQEELFARAVDAAVDSGAGSTAWRLAEHARARVFYARMAGTPADQSRTTPRSFAPSSAGDLAARYDVDQTPEDHGEILAALDAKERVIFGTASREMPTVPEWVTSRPDDPWSPGPDTGVLEFFVTEEGMRSFFVTADGAQIYDLPLARGAIERAVTRLRQLLETPEEGEQELARRSAQLYRWLVEPHAEMMEGLHRLVVVPYGILNYVPFGVLGGEDALLAQFEVCRAPSAAILAQLLAATAPTVRNAIVFADPHPDDDLLGLPYAADEARRVVSAIPAEVACGPVATTDRFLAGLVGHDILHLACHASFDPHEPKCSSLLLADPVDPRRPAYVSARQLYTGRTDAKLAVLSGCQTGLADLAPGGELDGLVRAFLTAGVHAVVASQWRVDDEATADIMAGMYCNLARGILLGPALRAAQLAVRTSADFTHPYFWSGFELTGDWRLDAAPGEGTTKDRRGG